LIVKVNSAGAKWLRRQAYMAKYGVGSTTLNKWDHEGRIRTQRIGNLKYIEDRLPEPDSSNEAA
jgi:predicted site-specific integrase-resolvase